MDSVIFKDKITENNYKEFVEQIVNVFRLSNPDKYILFSLRLENSDCIMKLSILRNDGSSQNYEEVKIDSNEPYFYEFLDYFVASIRDHCEIVKEDIVNLDDDHFVAFRMISKYNDLLTFDGLTQEQANHLLKPNVKETDVKLSVSNRTGASNFASIIFMIISLIVSIIGVILFVQ